ncbi:hypothetical protein GCM10011375_29570 [Hymenobacter qilianensis]|uniref:Uncharacterized protein n=1 Tax=Hymenobacter qilianensis TaxID=1385715 RepID=A0ACB5PU79_9BACT|nr:hypothetical protein GCM10011375_29570 [Hymenobacter qilianensis]
MIHSGAAASFGSKESWLAERNSSSKTFQPQKRLADELNNKAYDVEHRCYSNINQLFSKHKPVLIHMSTYTAFHAYL